MILCLDVGNSQIYGGVFKGDELVLRFRKSTSEGNSSDEYGLFLRSVLRENGIDPEEISRVGICSVVPDRLHSLKNCCRKYFGATPFILQAGVKTGLKIRYKNPLEIGADRIADAIAATHLYPGKHLIVVDFGTATTVEAIHKTGEFLGGAILPGVRISMEALESRTSRLPSVEIVAADSSVGQSTIQSIQSGLYYGTVGAIRELIDRMQAEVFQGDAPVVIGTGGFVGLFKKENLFNREEPDLVLQGLYLAMGMNPGNA